MPIELHDTPQPDALDALIAGVRAHNVAHLGQTSARPLTVLDRADDGRVRGGVSGRTIYRQFLIDVVWVDPSARSSGLGRHLMAVAEAEARHRACLAAQVDTLSFQAPGFYEKLGFEVVGRVTGVADSPDRLFLLKHYV